MSLVSEHKRPGAADRPETPEGGGAAETPEVDETTAAPTAGKPAEASEAGGTDRSKPSPTPEELELYQAFASTERSGTPSGPLGYRSRSERRTYRRAARVRKSRAKLWLVVGPASAAIAAIVVLLTLMGGPETETRPTTTVAPAKVYAGGLLVIENGDEVPAVVLLQAREGGGLVLSIPGLTLVNTPSEGFKTLADLYATDGDADLDVVLGDAFSARPAATASVEWSELQDGFAAAGMQELPSQAPISDEDEHEEVALAVLTSLAAGESGAKALWDAVPLEGDSSGFRDVVAEIASSVAEDEWTAAGLSGRLVESSGGEYLEPDVRHAKALLEGTVDDLVFTLQVQNGSGVVGIAEQTVELLEPMGYTMLPVGNAEGFPDVEQTRITASPDAAAEARRVRSFLGVGIVAEDEALESGHLILVLGKDYVPPTTTTGSTG